MNTTETLPEPKDCECGEESTKGCHGIKDNEVYSEYLCDSCFSKRLK